MSSFISLLRSLFLLPTPAAVRSTEADLHTLFRMSRGRDSVSPAVLRKLAEVAGK
jgi:hypothetical protein